MILISGWKGKTNESSPLSALSRLMKRRAITTSSSHRIRVWRLKCIIGLASCCASGITESFRNIIEGEGSAVLASGDVGRARGDCDSDSGIQSHLPVDFISSRI